MCASLAAVPACVPSVAPPPDETVCRLSFSDAGDARVFVVGHSFTLEDAQSYATFEASIRRDMSHIAPCLSAHRPNVVLFPESIGILTWFLGRRALLARSAGDVATAFNAMYAGYYRQADYFRELYPGISSARALTLALSDTSWRAMDRTFGGIARTYGVHVITSADLPRSELRLDDPRMGLLRDPDAPADQRGVYVPLDSRVTNNALLYGPDGRLMGRIEKAYLTPEEIDTLDLASGRLDEMQVFDLPFARIGAAISRDAWYPPFNQRMEDLGVEMVAQPEAFSGGWTIEDRGFVCAGQACPPSGAWLPDVVLASGWSATQHYRGLRYSAAPMLNGNLIDLVFDGQVWITGKATPGSTLHGFVGSPGVGGFVALGPWTFPDPAVAEPGLSIQDRQTRLRTLGETLRPGSGSASAGRYARTLEGADLFFYGRTRRPPSHDVVNEPGRVASRESAPSAEGHQFNPEASYDAAGHLGIVWTDTREGREQVYFVRSADDGLTFGTATAVARSEGRQLRPCIAAAGDGEFVVAWQELFGGGERIHVGTTVDGGVTFVDRGAVEQGGGGAQWEPDLAVRPGTHDVALVWTDFRAGIAPAVRLARSADGGMTFSSSVRIDTPTITAPAGGHVWDPQPSQMQPSVAFTTDGTLGVAWIDYRERDWGVFAAIARGPDGTVFSPGTRIGPTSTTEVLASDPQLTTGPGGEFLLTWDDLRARRAHHDVRGARWIPSTAQWQDFPLLAGGAEDGQYVSRFRPSVGAVAGAYRVLFQDMTAGKNALGIAVLDVTNLTSGARVTASRFDDTGRADDQLTRPRIAVRRAFDRGVVVFEDDRAGWSRVRVSPLM